MQRPSPPLPHVDLDALSASIEELTKTLRKQAASSEIPIVYGEPEGTRSCALLLKRTYKIESGKCVLAPPEDQMGPCFEDVPYEEVDEPFVAPLIAVDESFAFKPRTDLIVQAHAHAYQPGVRETLVSIQFADVLRELRVFGDRMGTFDRAGRPRFSPAEPFEHVPLRWDHAYGGFDGIAAERDAERLDRALAMIDGEADPGTMTPYHYPRNPAGRGFLVGFDEESFGEIVLPNVEHPDAPLSPERMAAKDFLGWIGSPLPASWDYVDLSWFPRSGYLGLTPPHAQGIVPEEVKRGWAAKDILERPNVLHLASPHALARDFTQAAAPGMSFAKLRPDERLELRNLHPHKPLTTVELPGEIPHAELAFAAGVWTELTPVLNTVVVRVPIAEVEMLWSSRVALPAGFDVESLVDVDRRVTWRRPKQGASS